MTPPRLLLSGLLPCLLAVGCIAKPAAVKPPPLQKVEYVLPVEEQVTEYEEFTGRTAPVEMIELKSRVSGHLVSLGFDDGSDVKRGETLFTIDPRPFEAEAARTEAAVAQYQARVNRMSRQYDRLNELLQKKAISQDEFDTVRFDRAEAEASLKAAEAARDAAALNVEYAKIKAPISGRISRRMVDPGNLVQADVTALANIVPLERVYVYFDVDERTVLKLRRLVQEGRIPETYMTDTVVEIALADSADFKFRGKVDFEENQIDAATGTLRVRAVIENADRFLSPGMFVRIRYPIGKASPSLLIPEESLGSDQGRPFVFIIGEENKVQSRPVTLGAQIGVRRVVRDGVETTDKVVVTGLQRIKKNQQVSPQERPRTSEKVADDDGAAQQLSASAAPGRN